jgi:hypothetical protein
MGDAVLLQPGDEGVQLYGRGPKRPDLLHDVSVGPLDTHARGDRLLVDIEAGAPSNDDIHHTLQTPRRRIVEFVMTLLRVLVATVWGTRNDPGQAHLRARPHQVVSTSFAGRPNVPFFVVWGVAEAT